MLSIIKSTSTLFVFILLATNTARAQTEAAIAKIRQQYAEITSNKNQYITDVETYLGEEEDPEAARENETGDYYGTKVNYLDDSYKLMLIEIDETTEVYATASKQTRKREYYFWEGDLFFYFEHTESQPKTGSPAGTTTEERIYIANGQIIRWLKKQAEGTGQDLSKVANTPHPIGNGATSQYKQLSRYVDLAPEW